MTTRHEREVARERYLRNRKSPEEAGAQRYIDRLRRNLLAREDLARALVVPDRPQSSSCYEIIPNVFCDPTIDVIYVVIPYA